MGIFDNAKNKANEFLNSDSGEQKSDAFLDKAADFAKDKLGADKADKIDRIRDAADEKIGNNNGARNPETDPQVDPQAPRDQF